MFFENIPIVIALAILLTIGVTVIIDSIRRRLRDGRR
jgi:hypothetical protein